MCRVLHFMWKSLLWLEPPKFHCRTGMMRKLLFSSSTEYQSFLLHQWHVSTRDSILLPLGTWHLSYLHAGKDILFFPLCSFPYHSFAKCCSLEEPRPMSDRQGRLGIWVLPLGNFSKYRKVCWKRWPAMTMPDTHLTGPSYGAVCSCCHWARGREMPFSKMTVLEFPAFCYFPLPSCDCPLSLSSLQSAHAQLFNT